jgi:hypothetical protein
MIVKKEKKSGVSARKLAQAQMHDFARNCWVENAFWGVAVC